MTMSGSYKSPKIYSRMKDNNTDNLVPVDDNLITILVVLFMALPLVAIFIYYMYTRYTLPGKEYSEQDIESQSS